MSDLSARVYAFKNGKSVLMLPYKNYLFIFFLFCFVSAELFHLNFNFQV